MRVHVRRSGFDNIHEAVLHSIALQVADRLMPELIQHMVENDHTNDHGLNEMEVERMRSMLMNEYAPSPLARALRPPPRRPSRILWGSRIHLGRGLARCASR